MTESGGVIKAPRTGRRLLTGVIVLVVVGTGVLLGILLLRPGPVSSLRGELHQVQTTWATYLGRVTGDDGSYIRLRAPAIVTVETSQDGGDSQVVVRSLNAEPYGLADEILIGRDQIVFLSSVATDSQLAGAYADALGR